MARFILTHSMQDLGDLIRYIGIIPYFPCGIPGYSVEEAVDPDLLWVDGGVWDWKGPMLRQGLCLYGKHLQSKAAFVSPDWFPDLANYRRNGYDFEGMCEDGLVPYRDRLLMAWLDRHGPTMSTTVRRECGFSKGFDTVQTRLQMQTFLTNADFAQPLNRLGQPYGWNRAVLTTPERLLGEERLNDVGGRSPEESLMRIAEHLHDCMPDVSMEALLDILK